ncbi:MAG: hypothetical protein ACI8RD_001908 [Bacillariaceae sp.]|jgi:hypothetical protein
MNRIYIVYFCTDILYNYIASIERRNTNQIIAKLMVDYEESIAQ